jgi:hypothetical protein
MLYKFSGRRQNPGRCGKVRIYILIEVEGTQYPLHTFSENLPLANSRKD